MKSLKLVMDFSFKADFMGNRTIPSPVRVGKTFLASNQLHGNNSPVVHITFNGKNILMLKRVPEIIALLAFKQNGIKKGTYTLYNVITLRFFGSGALMSDVIA